MIRFLRTCDYVHAYTSQYPASSRRMYRNTHAASTGLRWIPVRDPIFIDVSAMREQALYESALCLLRLTRGAAGLWLDPCALSS